MPTPSPAASTHGRAPQGMGGCGKAHETKKNIPQGKLAPVKIAKLGHGPTSRGRGGVVEKRQANFSSDITV